MKTKKKTLKTAEKSFQKEKGFISFGQIIKDTAKERLNKGSVFYFISAIVLAVLVFSGLFLYIANRAKNMPQPANNDSVAELKKMRSLETGFEKLKMMPGDFPSDSELQKSFEKLK